MNYIKVVSFDLHETLTTPDFILAVWYEGIPAIYAAKKKIPFDKAKEIVTAAYKTVNQESAEWSDLNFWFERFQLGDYHQALELCKNKVAYYPEVFDTLASLSKRYKMIITSSMPRQFMPPLLEQIGQYFQRVFSSASDFHLQKTPEFYRILCREMGITPSAMVHVGNSRRKDYDNPRQVGIHAVHLFRDEAQDGNSIVNLKQFEPVLHKIEQSIGRCSKKNSGPAEQTFHSPLEPSFARIAYLKGFISKEVSEDPDAATRWWQNLNDKEKLRITSECAGFLH